MGTYIFLKSTDGERVPAYRWEDMKGDSLESYRKRVKPGWAIVCGEEEEKKAADVIVEAMTELEKVGIITDFRYDLDGAFPGLEVLRVTGTEEKREPLELTTEEAIEVLKTYDMSDDNDDEEFKAAILKALEALEFANWTADEIFGDAWEDNKDAFAEIACRKLEKLGIVRANSDNWELAGTLATGLIDASSIRIVKIEASNIEARRKPE